MSQEKSLEKKWNNKLFSLLVSAFRDGILQKETDFLTLEPFEFEELFRLAEMHAVTSAVFRTVKNSNCPCDILKKWSDRKGQALTKEILFDDQLQKIENLFVKKEIPFVPMKGIIIKSLYPKMGIRQFSDFDILVKKPTEAKDAMKELGFSVLRENQTEDEVVSVIECQKQPVFNFEIHKRLFFYRTKGYFADIWDRIVFDGFKGSMTDEDVYLYHLAHFHSHAKERSGAGIRYIADHYILKKNLCSKDGFDREYVNSVLRGEKSRGEEEYFLELSQFEKLVDNLANNLFEKDKVDIEPLRDFLIYGIHGSVKNKIRLSLEKGSKCKFLFKNVFLPFDLMCAKYKILKKIPLLLPFCWIARVIGLLINKNTRKQIKVGLKHLIKF